MQKITRSTKNIALPDTKQIQQYRKAPHSGPKILFFSGGSALKELSKTLINYTHNSIHIITPFDSGGSSAELRKAFKMPAVGDIRNRLMALADQSIAGNPEIYTLFAHRLPKDAAGQELLRELKQMAQGKHTLLADIPDPMRQIIRKHLDLFLQHMPADFNLQGASIGNLILTSGYLEENYQLEPVIQIFSKLVEVRGIVRPVVNKDLHLVAELENGEMFRGQHLITGKQTNTIQSKIKRIFLSASPPEPTQVQIGDKIRSLIGQADLICYPVGSFFSSLVANLLPRGVGPCISRTNCPKVFIPNTYQDPECFNLTLNEQISVLFQHLQPHGKNLRGDQQVMDYILLDRDLGRYPGEIDFDMLGELNIEILQYDLISENSDLRIDPEKLQNILLSLG